MYKGKSILAVVPARGGSKGIKLKNLRTVAGKSLVAWCGEVLAKCQYIDRKVVSTDHDGIAEEAMKHGIEAPFRRPEDLAGDFISDLQVLTHALLAAESSYGQQFDVVVMLQPTSPARTVDHIEGCISKLIDEGLDAVWTVSPTDLKFHPLKQLLVDEQGHMDLYLEEGNKIIARQQLKPVYHRNGLCYAIARECLLVQRSIKGKHAGAVIVEGKIPNIDTMEDLLAAEEIVKNTKY